MAKQPLSPRELLQQQYKMARSNLLLMLVFTVANIVLLVTESETMFLFSATVPYLAVTMGIVSENMTFLGICICVTVIILVLYALCWLLSKQHRGWMITALVLFVLDTLALGALYVAAGDFSGILDAVIHVWVLYYLIIGVVSSKKLRDLPPEQTAEVQTDETDIEETEPANTFIPQLADTEVKARILAEGDAFGHHIVYRRVKRTNQLVIDGYVYDEIEMLVEPAHTLSATVDGHTVTVGFDGVANSFIDVDGQQIVKKKRFW